MKFSFKAKNNEGKLSEGIIEAANRDAALSVLQKNGLFPLNISAQTEELDFVKAIHKHYERVLPKELVVFFRQLAILIEARVPIVTALTAISEQTANKYFIKVQKDMIRDIEDGLPFSDAMNKHQDVFSLLSINIVRSGEASGNLKKSIDYVAENIERNYLLASRVKSAMIYPSIVMVVFFIIGFLVISFILPKLTQVIKDLNATVPWYTQVVMTVGDFMNAYWWAVAFAVIGVAVGTFYYVNSPDGKREWDKMKINLPIIGTLYRYVYITRFSENLAVLLVGGIPIIRALDIVSAVIGNTVYEKLFLKTAESVKVGGNMSDVLSSSPLVPPIVSHMVKIGEDSGQIDSVLNHIAKFYDQEVETMTKNLSTLIEPVLMIIIGIAVGFMAVAILMPIYNIAGQIQ